MDPSFDFILSQHARGAPKPFPLRNLPWSAVLFRGVGGIVATTVLAGLLLGGCANEGGAKAKQAALARSAATSALILVADTGNNRVVMMNTINGSGWREFGGSGKLNLPAGLALAADGKIYITEKNGARVVRIDNILGGGQISYGNLGSGSGQFHSVAGVALARDGKIYVADAGNGRIVRMDDMSGAGWAQYPPASGPVPHTFVSAGPGAIAVDGAGKIYLGLRDRIVRMDSIDGTGWTEYGTTGTGVGQFGNIQGLAIDGAGRILIADAANDRIVRIDNLSGSGWAEFAGVKAAGSVAVDSSGHITIADTGNNRILQVGDISGIALSSIGALGATTGQFTGPAGVVLAAAAVVGTSAAPTTARQK